MSLKGKFGARVAVLAAILGVELFGSSCGDYFRPVANPILQPGGDPQRTAHALVVSSNGSNQGTAVIIDVSGDTAAAVFSDSPDCVKCGVGRNPVYAVALEGTDYVVSRDDDSVADFTVASAGSPPNIISSLPAGASPVFAAVAQSKLFVADFGTNGVAVISGNNFTPPEIHVGPNPVALVAPPAPYDTQLYSLNQGDNTVSVIFPATNQNVTTISLPAGLKPVWGAASSDGTRVFVVNQGSHNVSVIDTASDTVISTLDVGADASPNYITYEATLNRAYVTSPAGNSLSIIENATGNAPTVTIRTMAGPPCNGQDPISVTALADGTRVYVADDVTSSVCVLNTVNNAFVKSIQVDATPVGIASNSDSTRVYTANKGTAVFSIASVSRVNNPATGAAAVTVTTTSNNPFAIGQLVTVAGVGDSTFDGQFGVIAVNSPTQFVYSQTCAVQAQCPNSSSSGGTATILPDVSIIETSDDTTVKSSDGVAPLTIPAGGTPTFITMTP